MDRVRLCIFFLGVSTFACGAAPAQKTSTTGSAVEGSDGTAMQEMVDGDGNDLGGLADTGCDILLANTDVKCADASESQAGCSDVLVGTFDVADSLKAQSVGVKIRVGRFDTDYPTSSDTPGHMSDWIDVEATRAGGAAPGFQRYAFTTDALSTDEGPVTGIGGHAYDSLFVSVLPFADTAQGRLFDARNLSSDGAWYMTSHHVDATVNYDADDNSCR